LDGLNWWANTAQGTGAVRLRNATTNAILKTFIADFGSYFEYSFTTNYALKTSTQTLSNAINLYPNPSAGRVVLQGDALQGCSFGVMNAMGQSVLQERLADDARIELNTQGWVPGVYWVSLRKGDATATKKLVVQ
jgi:hypothetical protein